MKGYNKIIFPIIIILVIIASIAYKIYEKFQIVDCNTLTNCKACSNMFGCLWCAQSKKCVSDLSNSTLCPQENTIADPMGCDDISNVSSNSGSTFTGGKCSINTDCKSCLTSPGCFWCANKQICSSNEDVYSDCADEKNIYNSINQCPLQKSLNMNYPKTESIIPIEGLARNTDDSLTNQSLKIIFDSFAAKGNPIIDTQSKQNALQMVNNEKEFYNNKYKSYMNTYVDNSIDYNTDEKSLSSAQTIQKHIQDLDDVSRYINNYNTSQYVEGYQNINEDKFQYVLLENKGISNKIQLLWLGNLIALGTLFYLMK
jgi:hypothetical protein